MEQGYRAILKQKHFMRNIVANIINRFGDSIDAIAFSWLVYSITGSASWSAIILGVNIMPNIFIQPFAGAIVERLSKKKVIVLCDIGRGIIVGLILVLYLQEMLSPWLLLVITFVLNTFESFRNPADTCFIPLILHEEYFEFGLSFNQTTSRICELVGTGLAGVVIALLGIQGAIAIDMISFFLSALILFTIPANEVLTKSGSSIGSKIKTCLVDLKEGFQYVLTSKVVLMICFIALIVNAALTPINSFLAPYISGVLHSDATLLSVMSMSMTLGIAAGSFLYPFTHKRISNRHILLIGGIATGVFYMALSAITLLTNAVVILISLSAASFLYCIMVGQMSTLSGIAFMTFVDKKYLGRASAIFSAIVVCGIPIMSFLLSFICHYVSIIEIFIFFGVFTIVVFIGMMFVKTIKEI